MKLPAGRFRRARRVAEGARRVPERRLRRISLPSSFPIPTRSASPAFGGHPVLAPLSPLLGIRSRPGRPALGPSRESPRALSLRSAPTVCFAITFACVAASSPPALRPSLSCTPQLAPCCVAQAKRLACGLLARGGELCRPPRLHDSHTTRRPDGARGLLHAHPPPWSGHPLACRSMRHTSTHPNTTASESCHWRAYDTAALRRMLLRLPHARPRPAYHPLACSSMHQTPTHPETT